MIEALVAVLVVPALEEWVFRVMLLTELDRRLPRFAPIGTNALCSLLFCLAHLIHAPWEHAVAVFFPSMLFGAIWQRWKSFRLCWAAHAACNLAWICHQSAFHG